MSLSSSRHGSTIGTKIRGKPSCCDSGLWCILHWIINSEMDWENISSFLYLLVIKKLNCAGTALSNFDIFWIIFEYNFEYFFLWSHWEDTNNWSIVLSPRGIQRCYLCTNTFISVLFILVEKTENNQNAPKYGNGKIIYSY